MKIIEMFRRLHKPIILADNTPIHPCTFLFVYTYSDQNNVFNMRSPARNTVRAWKEKLFPSPPSR